MPSGSSVGTGGGWWGRVGQLQVSLSVWSSVIVAAGNWLGKVLWYAAKVCQGLSAEVCGVHFGANIAKLFGRFQFPSFGRSGEFNHYGTNNS